MKKILFLLLMAYPAYAIDIPTLAGLFSIAASSGTIIKEGHDLIKHPVKTLKLHGKQIKDAAKGKK